MTPQSSKISKKRLDLKKLKTTGHNIDEQGFKSFVVGFCGGDCAGKKEMVNYLFRQEKNGDWYFQDSK